jgi:hypothetical protein
MAGNKYMGLVSGVRTLIAALQTSAGAGDAGKIIALDSTGKIDNSMMPTGIGAETKLIACTEDLAAGDLVNIYNASGAKCRKADATTAGKEAHGFVLASATNGQNATVYTTGINTQVTGLTPGPQALSTSAGLCVAIASAPSSTGNVNQFVGVALSATELEFVCGEPVTQ